MDVAQVKIGANDRIRETQRDLGLGDGERLPFLCECDEAACRAIVQLTVKQYADHREAGARILRPGHGES